MTPEYAAVVAVPGSPVAAFDVPPGVRRVVVGCSGGADSLALLALSVAAGLHVVAVHVDHGLRAGSASERHAVERAAARFGVESVGVAVAVAAGPNLEARARDARLAALETQRAARDLDAVLLGHTRDDQAETVLLNLLRGAGATGLSGIPPTRDRFVHPMLAVSRADTLEVCARCGLRPLRDPMNDDHAFRRVWLRREVLPMLEAGTGRDLRALLARQATVLRDESDYLDGLGAALLREAGGPAGETSIQGRVLAAADIPVARRAVRLWLGSPPPALAEVEAVLAVARGERRAVELSGGERVERSKGRLRHVRGPASSPARALDTWIEHAPPVRWPDGRWMAVLDADVAGDDVALADDRVVVDETGTPLWDVGYGVAVHARVTAATRRYLWARVT